MIFLTFTTDADLRRAFPLMATLRDRITNETFVSEIRLQQREGYELIGLFDESNILVTLAGFRFSHTLARGPHLFVDDLITAETERGKGYGRQMLKHLAARAKARGLDRLYLDSRATARGFYEQAGFQCLTSIPCWVDVATMLTPSH